MRKRKPEMGHSEVCVEAEWSENAGGHPKAMGDKELKSELEVNALDFSGAESGSVVLGAEIKRRGDEGRGWRVQGKLLTLNFKKENAGVIITEAASNWL